MKLLIVSDMPHYLMPSGDFAGWGPTVEEIDHLARVFERIIHVGVLYPGPPPGSMLPYRSSRVQFVPLQPAGGPRLVDKLGILAKAPAYLTAVFRHLSEADVLHVRCPSNVGLLVMPLLSFISRPRYRWVKYAGNWNPTGPEAVSYRLQRWWLNHGLHRGSVTVNGSWPGQPRHVYSFLNPSLTLAQLKEADLSSAGKKLLQPLQILFVGRVETAKGAGRMVQIACQLAKNGIDFHIDMIGDGPERIIFQQLAQGLGLGNQIRFHGWLPHESLAQFYKKAHFQVLPTMASEGWPKVLSEGMAYGVVPIAGAVSSIPQVLEKFGAGMALPPEDPKGFVRAICDYLDSPDRWVDESNRARDAARHFTYEAYLKRLSDMMKNAWGLELEAARP